MLPRDPEPNTQLLYECLVGQHNLLSLDVGCEGLTPLGPVGWIYQTQVAGAVALYRCRVDSSGDHFISPDAACEGQVIESQLGYVLP